MRAQHTVQIADHLWEALERMAAEMGSDREALLNQAIHVFARLNGYLVPGAAFRDDVPTGPHPTEPERRAVAEQVMETAARLERAMQAPPPVPVTGTASLVLVREDGTEDLVAKERFVIGRGRHCDLVVESGKVSREHAVLTRESGGWFIEDLDSSNGTWFKKERITRRRIEDGDEYFVCSERLRCQLR